MDRSQTTFFSPEGTTRIYGAEFMPSLRDSPSLFYGVHGLAPVATTYRPVGTKSQSFTWLRCSTNQRFIDPKSITPLSFRADRIEFS